MQINVGGEIKDISVHTITLRHNGNNGDMYAFHCIGCGHMIQQVGGEVAKVYPLYEPSEDVVTVIKCRKCDKRYTFQTHKWYRKKPIITMLYAAPHTRELFYCWNHGAKYPPMLEYTTEYIYDNAAHSYHQTPFILACPITGCQLIYYFVDKL